MKPIKPEYLNESEKENNVLNECSWVAVISDTDSEPKVVFYNYKGGEYEEINTFSEFFEVAKELVSLPKGDDVQMKNHEGEFTSAFYATGSSVIQDYEEYSGKEIEIPVVKSVVVDCYNGGVTLEQIPTLISQTEKTLDYLDNDEVISIKESLKEDKDPYVRYGVSKSFI